jgi:hypothetical protein
MVLIASVVFNAASGLCQGWYKYVYGESIASIGQSVIGRINDAMCTNLISVNSAIWKFYLDYSWLLGGGSFARAMIADVWGLAKFFCTTFKNDEPITDPEGFAEVFAGQVERCWTLMQGQGNPFPNPKRHPLGDEHSWKCAEIFYDFTETTGGSDDFVSLFDMYNVLARPNMCGEDRRAPALLFSPYAVEFINNYLGRFNVDLDYDFNFIDDYSTFRMFQNKFDSIWWCVPKDLMVEYYSSIIDNPYIWCCDEKPGIFGSPLGTWTCAINPSSTEDWDSNADPETWEWDSMKCCTGLYSSNYDSCDCDDYTTIISGYFDNVVPYGQPSLYEWGTTERWDSGIYQHAPYEVFIDVNNINTVFDCGTTNNEFKAIKWFSGDIEGYLTSWNNAQCGTTSCIPFTEALCSLKNIKTWDASDPWPYSRRDPQHPGTAMSAITGCGKIIIRYFDYLSMNQLRMDPSGAADDFPECDYVDVLNNYDSDFLDEFSTRVPFPANWAANRDIIAVCINKFDEGCTGVGEI